MHGFVADAVASPAFASVWEASLRSTHTQLTATLRGDPDSAVSLSDAGSVRLELGPIIAEVRERLISSGVVFAEAIPATDRSIVLVKDTSLGALPLLYAAVIALGSWLPWVALALLCAGVLCAQQRRRAVIATSLAATGLMTLVGLALTVTRSVVTVSFATSPMTPRALGAVFDAVVSPIAATVLAIGALGAAVALTAWASGPAPLPRWIRGSVVSASDRLRASGDRRGVSTGALGAWVQRQRSWLRVLLLVGAAMCVVLIRPLTFGTVLWTAAIALIALVAIELVRRPETRHPAG